MKNKAAEDMQQYAKKCVRMKYQQQKQTMKYANSNKHSMSLKRSNRKKEEENP